MKDFWKYFLDKSDVSKEILEFGYSKERKFKDYFEKFCSEMGFDERINTAQNISIDFYEKQPKTLVKNGKYVLRTGFGKFMVFDEFKFDKPYLNLNFKEVTELEYTIPEGFDHLYDCYKKDNTENSKIEQLQCFGIFEKIANTVSNEEKCLIGPRGNKVSEFDTYLYDTDGKIKHVFKYTGQEELDYSIFTKDSIYLFEAKSVKNGLDLGWHKIAFPSNRFLNYGKRIIPGYILNQKNNLLIYIFKGIESYKNGIILNDKTQLEPKYAFKIKKV
ncbi:hypothetical protein HNP93_000201 [Methanococcus maripaludis]|uniref:Uncharacterized protein n=1 Tax=Methanococcus maripaludis TaxID=39152 RepID=A0A7J9P3R7_METMI|nr:hypothetical protein [Methanococcus maripaludis]MBA2857500.1 hypothetical protein [Methanococcus maripaludis]